MAASKTATKKTGNLFSAAKETGTKKDPKSKDQKVRIRAKDPDFFEKIKRLQDLQEQMKRDKAEADMISDEIKELSKAEWARLFDKTGKNPGSVMVDSKSKLDTAQVMFVPSDKYISINEDRAAVLTEKYGDDIVTEATTYSFNSEMIEKYGEVLSTLITDCDDIEEEDKSKIIKAEVNFSVTKGSIDKMKEYSESTEVDITEVMEDIQPVVALKNVEIIKG